MEATIKELPTSPLADLARENTALRAENYKLRKALEHAENIMHQAEMDRNRHAGQVRYTRRLWKDEMRRADRLEKYKSDVKSLRVALFITAGMTAIFWAVVALEGFSRLWPF